LLIGTGVLLIGKILGSVFSNLSSGSKVEKDFGNFRVVEDEKELIIYDRTGEKILIIEKE
jgi:nucleoid DNA-binding protein